MGFEPIGSSGVTGGAGGDGQKASAADVGKHNRHTGCHQCADELHNGISVMWISTTLVIIDDCHPEQRSFDARVHRSDMGAVIRIDQRVDIDGYGDADWLIRRCNDCLSGACARDLEPWVLCVWHVEVRCQKDVGT